MHMGMRIKRCFLILFGVAFMLTACSTVQSEPAEEAEQIPSRSNYKEDVKKLPFWEEGMWLEDVCALSDNSLAVWTSDNRLFVQAAGQKEWMETACEDMNGWYESRKGEMIFTRLAPDGARFAYTTFVERKDSQGKDIWGEQHIEYQYLSADGQAAEGSWSFAEEDYISDFYFSPKGELFCGSYNRVYQVMPQSGERILLLETKNHAIPYFDKEVMLLPDTGGLFQYDLGKKEQLDGNKMLDAFLQEKLSSGGAAYIQPDEEGNLYLLLKDGFYRYLKGGSSIEQLFAASEFLAESLEPESCLEICLDENDKVSLFCKDGTQRIYGTHLVKEPEVTLTVYRLLEEELTDNDMRAAIKEYQNLHPEIQIKYEIGMLEAAPGQTREDVIRNLNLELAAGKGPDLLILDNLPFDAYKEQGILADIAPVIDRAEKRDGLVPQIVKHYREEDNAVYRIPLGFTLEVISGPEELLGDRESVTLRELTDNMAAYYGKEENRPNSGSTEGAEGWWSVNVLFHIMINDFAPNCMGAWVAEDGSLQTEALAEYLSCLKQLQDLIFMNWETYSGFISYAEQNPGATAMDWYFESLPKEDIFRELENSTGVRISNYAVMTSKVGSTYIWEMGPGEIGNLGDEGRTGSGYPSAVYLLDSMRKQPERTWKLFDGQLKNTFLPRKMMGVVQNTQNRKEAEAFLEYLLSAENAPRQYSLTFSVNEKVLEKNFADFPVIENYGDLDCQEYIRRIREILPKLEAPAPEYGALLEIVKKEGCAYLFGDCSLEEAVENIRRQTELSMAE